MDAPPDTSTLFPESLPFDSGVLDCSEGHVVAFTQRGNPAGIPLLLLHGGPGSGATPRQAMFFDPLRFRIIQFDQRGCGLSQPAGGIEHNTPRHLLADIERLRLHIGIDRWFVAGGSWGATLAALYAASHRSAVRGLLLRGFFLAGRQAIESFMAGSARCHPAAWTNLLHVVPAWIHPLRLLWLAQAFRTGDAQTQGTVALAWANWEWAMSGHDGTVKPDAVELAALCQRYRVHSHYLLHDCWLGDAAVLHACRRLRGLPTLFLHGRTDQICRPAAAWRAHRAATGSTWCWVAEVGHDPFHPAMVAAMQRGIEDLVRR